MGAHVNAKVMRGVRQACRTITHAHNFMFSVPRSGG